MSLPETEMTSRRRLLAALGGLGAGVALPGTAAATDAQHATGSDSLLQTNQSTESLSSGDSWPQYRGDAANTARQPDAVGPADGNRRWAFRFGIVDGLAVDDSTLYATELRRVTAYDRTDRTRQWQFRAESTIRYPPIVAQETLYVATDSTVYAVDTTDGTERWRVGPRITIAETGIAVGAEAVFFDGHGGLYAVDKETGEKRRVFSPDGPDEIVTPPAIADGTVYVGARPDRSNSDSKRTLTVYAVDPDDGTKKWSSQSTTRPGEYNGLNISGPVVVDGLVLVGSKHRLFAFGDELSTPTPTPTETDTPESSTTAGTDSGTPGGTDRTETAQTAADAPLPTWLSVASVAGLSGYLARRATRDDD